MSQAAAVIDLEELRRRRAARQEPRPAPAPRPRALVAMFAPMCVVWVPVWTVT